jgi:hypothetical protein
MMFLRGGNLSFDIGWVGCISGSSNIADGENHTVCLRFKGGKYELIVDGGVEASGMNSVPDHDETKIVIGSAIGHEGRAGDMAPRFDGNIWDVAYTSSSSESKSALPPFDPPFQIPESWRNGVSLQSFNYKEKVWTVRSREDVGIDDEPSNPNSKVSNFQRFRVFEPLYTKDKRGGSEEAPRVSFESIANPGHFLRHCKLHNRLSLHPRQSKEDYLMDSTFIVKKGLKQVSRANASVHEWVSFQSINFPHMYIGHRGFKLSIEESEDSDLHLMDATFKVINNELEEEEFEVKGGETKQENLPVAYPVHDDRPGRDYVVIDAINHRK